MFEEHGNFAPQIKNYMFELNELPKSPEE